MKILIIGGVAAGIQNGRQAQTCGSQRGGYRSDKREGYFLCRDAACRIMWAGLIEERSELVVNTPQKSRR